MNAEIRYWLSVGLRRVPLFLLVALPMACLGLAAAVIMPTVYTASGKLLVEDPQIPARLAASTVQVNEREQLAIVRQQLLTRTTLLEIARDYDVYEGLDQMNADEIVRRMRADTEMRAGGRRDTATVMDIAFEARSGAIAADVVNEYITRVLAVNATRRQTRASQTLEFFEQEVERLETELNLRNEDMLRFQNENRDALPSTLEYRMNRQRDLRDRLAQLESERAALEERRGRLFELQQAGVTEMQRQEQASGEERRLASLREQLSSARAVYTEESPRVRMLKARIAALEEQVAAEPAVGRASGDAAGGGEAPAAGETLDPVTLQIRQLDAQIRRIGEQTVTLADELETLEATIERTPANAITLQALRRDYDHVLRQYNLAMNRLSEASTGERIETLSKGRRITVIEQAAAPTEPSAPNRPMIAGTGIAAGIGAGTVLVGLLEFLDRAIRRPVDLSGRLGITPIATVPYIATPGERIRRRLLGLLGIAAIVVLVPAGLWFVHYQVLPLDLIYDRLRTELLP